MKVSRDHARWALLADLDCGSCFELAQKMSLVEPADAVEAGPAAILSILDQQRRPPELAELATLLLVLQRAAVALVVRASNQQPGPVVETLSRSIVAGAVAGEIVRRVVATPPHYRPMDQAFADAPLGLAFHELKTAAYRHPTIPTFKAEGRVMVGVPPEDLPRSVAVEAVREAESMVSRGMTGWFRLSSVVAGWHAATEQTRREAVATLERKGYRTRRAGVGKRGTPRFEVLLGERGEADA